MSQLAMSNHGNTQLSCISVYNSRDILMPISWYLSINLESLAKQILLRPEMLALQGIGMAIPWDYFCCSDGWDNYEFNLS